MRSAIGVLVLVLATSRADAAPPTGTITGTVTVSDDKGKAVRDALVVVYVVGPPASAAEPDAKPAILTAKHRVLIPELLAITAGDAVEFPNTDVGYHNLFSPRPHKFDFGTLKRGDPTKTRTFDGPGVVDVYCNIHPQMAATILVLPNRHHMTFTAGPFILEGVPVGTWKVFTFTRGAKPTSKQIEVVPGGTAVDLALTRGPIPQHPNKYGEKYRATPYP